MYKDKEDKLHLAWVDVDDAYLDKAYYNELDRKTGVTLRLGYGCDLYADKECFKEVSVYGRTEDAGMFMINLANTPKGHKIYRPQSNLVT